VIQAKGTREELPLKGRAGGMLSEALVIGTKGRDPYVAYSSTVGCIERKPK
jgi:hypothetical protein